MVLCLKLAERLQRRTRRRHLELAGLLLRGVDDNAVSEEEERAVAAHAHAFGREVPLQAESRGAVVAAVAHHAQLAVRAQLVAPRVHHEVVVWRNAPHLRRC